MKRIIAFDMDDTAICLVEEWLMRSNKDFSDNVVREDVKTWAIHEYVKCGRKIFDYLNDEELYKSVEPFPDAVSVVKELRNHYNVIFVTASYHRGKIERMKELGLISSDDEWIVARNKSFILADFLIDDRPKNISDFLGVGFIFDAPWNRDVNGMRFKNWKEIGNHFLCEKL